jgi:hypothetical protein
MHAALPQMGRSSTPPSMPCRGLVLIYGLGPNLSVGYLVHHDGHVRETKTNRYSQDSFYGDEDEWMKDNQIEARDVSRRTLSSD